MLAILPLLAFVLLWLLLLNLDAQQGWRLNFLRAALLCGVWLVASTEILSLMQWITQLGLAIAWLLPSGVSISLLVSLSRKKELIWRPDLSWLKQWHHALLATLILMVLVITALVAWTAPPNEWETLRYRMARVAHWAQGKSVAHYPTAIEEQNSLPALAEYACLHEFILAGTDRPVNFVSWFAILGCIIGVSVLADLLGSKISGQLLASTFAATLPLSIVQASSLMNEGVVALWVTCAATELMLLWTSNTPTKHNVLFLATAAGLALATKPLAAPFLLPLAMTTAIVLFSKVKLSQYLLLGVAAAAICLCLNGGHLWRNLQTYHTLLDQRLTHTHNNEMRTWQGLLSNLLRNAAMQSSTPWQGINYQITRLVVGIHNKLGIDVNDPRTTAHGEFWVRPVNTTDHTSPSSFHAWALLLSFLLSIFRCKTFGWRNWGYQAIVLGGYIVFCYVFKWQIFGTRYLLPFFILYAPLLGVSLPSRWPTIHVLLGVGLFIASTPWLFGLQSRPLIAGSDTNQTDGLFTTPREQLYFGTARSAYLSYKHVAEKILASDCREVGLYLSGTSREYLWWVVLGAPQSQIRIEWLMAGASARYFDPSFSPCAIISDAEQEKNLFGLPLVHTESGLNLYLRDEK